MPKPIFLDGQDLTADIMTKVDNVKFVPVPNDYGQRGLITDAELDTGADSLLGRFNTFQNAFLVTAGSGLGFNYTGGRVTDSKNNSVVYSSGSGVVPANSTSFVYITNAVLIGSYLPQECLPLAQIVSGGTSILSIVILRPDRPVIVQPRTIRRDGGNGRDGVLNVSTGIVPLDGLRNYQSINFTGGTIFAVPGFIDWQVQGDCYLNGTIIVRPSALGGRGLRGGAVPGTILASPGSGVGGGAGHNFIPALPYALETSLFGSGGAGGLVWCAGGNAGIIQSSGGDGGGGFRLAVVGNLVFGPNFKLFVEGGDASPAVIYQSTPPGYWVIGAGGGGSGGGVDITCYGLCSAQGYPLISVRGGNGNIGAFYNVTGATAVIGGGCGGGGRVSIKASSFNFNPVTGVNIITSPNYITPWPTYPTGVGSGSVPDPWYYTATPLVPPSIPNYTIDTSKLNINIANGFNGATYYCNAAYTTNVVGFGPNGVLLTASNGGVVQLNGNVNGVLTNSNLAQTLSAFNGSPGGSFGGSGTLLGTTSNLAVEQINVGFNKYGTSNISIIS